MLLGGLLSLVVAYLESRGVGRVCVLSPVCLVLVELTCASLSLLLMRVVCGLGQQGGTLGSQERVCHGVGAAGLLEDLLHRRRVVEKEHVQVFLQVLVRLRLRHQVLPHWRRLVRVRQLLRVEHMVGLV